MSEVHVWTNAGGVLEKVDALKPRIRCENCRWWTPIVTVEPVAGKRYELEGECGGIPTTWDWRLETGDPGEQQALMTDANARLFTSPTFSCALHEPVA